MKVSSNEYVLLSVFSSLAVVLSPVVALAQVQFTSINDGDVKILHNSRGASWVDFDGDQDLDLYVSIWGGRNRLLRNNGNNEFENVSVLFGSIAGRADFNADGEVAGTDLLMMLGSWGEVDPALDIDASGVVDGSDLLLLLGNWGTVPENGLQGYLPSYSGRAVFGDFDNDGDPDLFYVNSGPNILLRNDGNVFTDVSNFPRAHNGIGRGCAWSDYDGDGFIDLYFSSTFGGPANSANYLLHNEGDGTFLDATPPVLADPATGRGVGWCDYDNDGDQDLYLCNGWPGDDLFPQNNRLFRNDGAGIFTDVTTTELGYQGHSRGLTWGDYDNDGDFDLYVSSLKVDGIDGDNKLYRNDGTMGFAEITPPELVAPLLQTRDCSWVDIDNDGDLDLYIANALKPNILFINEGNGVFINNTPAGLDNDANANSAAWADFNNDGRLDVYLANKFSNNELLRNDTINANHWVQFRLHGTTSNADAIGARITIQSVSVGMQIREIQSGSGYLSQHMLRAHFGLGQDSNISTVTIRWPSGLIQVLNNVDVDMIHDIIEP